MVRLWFKGNPQDGWWELRIERRKHPEARPVDTGYWPMSVMLTQVREILDKFGAARAPALRGKRRRESDGGKKK